MNSNLPFQMRLFRIDQMLSERGEVSSEDLMKALQCSLPTLKRDLRYMRDQLGAPVHYYRRSKVYRYVDADEKVAKRRLFTWYSPMEVKACFTALELFDEVEREEDGALLAPEMKALKARLLALVADESGKLFSQFKRRIKVVTPKVKLDRSPYFEMIGSALMHQKRLLILYYTKARREEKPREISPLRLVNYKNRWYLQAWCHQTDAMKTFNLECIRAVELTEKACKACPMKEVEALDDVFGIFSGGKLAHAVIHFDATIGVYVKAEVWHKDQQVTENDDGTVTLNVPYANETELLGQILAYGSHAEVLEPPALRKAVKKALTDACNVYAREMV